MIYIEHLHDEKASLHDRVEQLQVVLRRYCLSLTKSHDDADDLVQDTWIKALGASPGLTHINPEALLLRIAKNTWIDQVRRKNHLSRLMDQARQEPISYTDDSRLEVEAAFRYVIQHLSPLQRTVFLLRDVLGYSIAEASRMLQTSEGAVKAALHRARQALADIKEEKSDTMTLAESVFAKEQIERLAIAYLEGDIGTLIQLIQKNNMESVAMIGLVQHKMLHRSNAVQAGRSTPNTCLFMAA